MDDNGKLSPEEMTAMGLSDPGSMPVAEGYTQTVDEYVQELTKEVAFLEQKQKDFGPTDWRARRIETLKKRLKLMS